MACRICRKWPLVFSVACLFALSSCQQAFNEKELAGVWEIITVDVTTEEISSLEKGKLKRQLIGKKYELLSNGEFLYGEGQRLFSAGGWTFDSHQQKIEFKYDKGAIKRLRFGISVIDDDHMFWSFTSSNTGGQIWQLERVTTN